MPMAHAPTVADDPLEAFDSDEEESLTSDVNRFFRLKSPKEIETRTATTHRSALQTELLGAASNSSSDGNNTYSGRRSGRGRNNAGGPASGRAAAAAEHQAAAAVAASFRMEQIPFWNIDHRKMVPIEVPSSDVKDDLALMQGKWKGSGRKGLAKWAKSAAASSSSPGLKRPNRAKRWLEHRGFLLCLRCSSTVLPAHTHLHSRICKKA